MFMGIPVTELFFQKKNKVYQYKIFWVPFVNNFHYMYFKAILLALVILHRRCTRNKKSPWYKNSKIGKSISWQKKKTNDEFMTVTRKCWSNESGKRQGNIFKIQIM